MPQKHTNLERVRISITTNQQVYDCLGALVATGLYGASVPEAVETILCEFLRNDLKRVRIKALEREKNL